MESEPFAAIGVLISHVNFGFSANLSKISLFGFQ
jgi:hypothetical protein